MTKNPWKKLSTKIVYKNPWIKVIEDKVIKPDGSRGIYAYVETRGPSVCVVAIDDNNEVYLIGQYRYTSGEFSWEVPNGNSDGEDVLSAAKRELTEETGLVAKRWENVGYFWVMNGVVREKCHVFIARDLTQTDKEEKREEGIVSVKKIPLGELLRQVKAGEITDDQSIVALAKAFLFLFNIDQYLA